MATVTRLLHDKGPHEVWSIAPEASMYEAIAMMAARGVGALVVLDGQTVVGMVSERDYARKVILQGFFYKLRILSRCQGHFCSF